MATRQINHGEPFSEVYFGVHHVQPAVNWTPFIVIISVLYALTMLAVVYSFWWRPRRAIGEGTPLTASAPPQKEPIEGAPTVRRVHRDTSWMFGDAAKPPPPASVDEQLEFVRKVYSILSTQLLFTAGAAVLFVQLSFDDGDPAKPTSFGRGLLGSSWVVWALFIPLLLVLCCLFAAKNWYPLNYLLLALFTAIEAFLLAFICCVYYAGGFGAQILLAAGITTVAFLALTLYTMLSRTDWSFLGPFLIAALVVLIVWGAVMGLVFAFGAYSKGWHLALSLAGALIFCAFIVYDTDRILRHSGVHDHIIAAVELYLDVVNLFLYVLQCLAICDGR